MVAHNYCAESRHSHSGGRGGNHFDFWLPPISSEHSWKSYDYVADCSGLHHRVIGGVPQFASCADQRISNLRGYRTGDCLGFPLFRFDRTATEFAGASQQLSLAGQRIAIVQNHERETCDHHKSRKPAKRIRDLLLAHVHGWRSAKYFSENET